MDASTALQVMRDTLAVVFQVSGPILLVALSVGTLIAILQAATQVSEMTLTFVPKIAAVGLMLWVLGGHFLSVLTEFGEHIFRLIGTVGGGAP